MFCPFAHDNTEQPQNNNMQCSVLYVSKIPIALNTLSLALSLFWFFIDQQIISRLYQKTGNHSEYSVLETSFEANYVLHPYQNTLTLELRHHNVVVYFQ